MRKNLLKDLEKIQESRKLNSETKNKIISRAIANAAIGISIDFLIFAFMLANSFLTETQAMIVYKTYAVVFLLCAIIIWEVAYRKDSVAWTVCGIEICILSIFTLFSPSIFLKDNRKIIYGIMIITMIYYTIKIIKICFSEKKKYMLEISDISDIIKKESQDKLLAEESLRKKEELKKSKLKKTKKVNNLKSKKTNKNRKKETK